MKNRYLLFTLSITFILGGWSGAHASSELGTGQYAGIGVITKPKTEAPHCIDPVSDIGIITKPQSEAPHCINPVQPRLQGVDVVLPDKALDSSGLKKGLSRCPVGMVATSGTTCLDRFEASRPDATAVSMGTDTSKATSRVGVLPWFPVDITTARAACTAAGKRLCKQDEMHSACRGPADTTYAYGDTYAPKTCNGIDTYCNCDSANCAGVQPCPYPGCYDRSPEGVIGKGCGAALRVMPTGSFPGCVNEYGAFDLSGNVWELVDRGTNESWYMGGAFNCLDSKALHRCNSLEQNISARGFRCCAEQGSLR